jgi:hypothetical protein
MRPHRRAAWLAIALGYAGPRKPWSPITIAPRNERVAGRPPTDGAIAQVELLIDGWASASLRYWDYGAVEELPPVPSA